MGADNVSQPSSHSNAPRDPGPTGRSADAELAIVLNGEAYKLPRGSRVEDLLARLELTGRRLAVALNHEVLPRSRRADRVLEDGDRIEILEAVGGG